MDAFLNKLFLVQNACFVKSGRWRLQILFISTVTLSKFRENLAERPKIPSVECISFIACLLTNSFEQCHYRSPTSFSTFWFLSLLCWVCASPSLSSVPCSDIERVYESIVSSSYFSSIPILLFWSLRHYSPICVFSRSMVTIIRRVHSKASGVVSKPIWSTFKATFISIRFSCNRSIATVELFSILDRNFVPFDCTQSPRFFCGSMASGKRSRAFSYASSTISPVNTIVNFVCLTFSALWSVCPSVFLFHTCWLFSVTSWRCITYENVQSDSFESINRWSFVVISLFSNVLLSWWPWLLLSLCHMWCCRWSTLSLEVCLPGQLPSNGWQLSLPWQVLLWYKSFSRRSSNNYSFDNQCRYTQTNGWPQSGRSHCVLGSSRCTPKHACKCLASSDWHSVHRRKRFHRRCIEGDERHFVQCKDHRHCRLDTHHAVQEDHHCIIEYSNLSLLLRTRLRRVPQDRQWDWLVGERVNLRQQTIISLKKERERVPLFSPGEVSPKPTTVPVWFTTGRVRVRQANWIVVDGRR